MIEIILVALLGAFFNMYRGGLLPQTKFFSGQYDLTNAAAFGAVIAVLATPVVAVFAALAMLRGAAPAWGPYVGAIIDQPRKTRPAVPYIDEIIEPIQNAKLWGMAGLSLRCAEWGLFLSFVFLSPLPLLAGALAGPIVFLFTKIVPTNYVWKTWEAVQGAFLWVACIV